MREWNVEVVNSPESLVAHSHIFDYPVTDDAARDFLERPGHVMLFAHDSVGRPIGFVSGVEMRHPDKPPEMFLYELGVEDEWRRQGVATALLRGLRAEALRRGCGSMWTGAERSNQAALATYASMGATRDDTSVFITWDNLEALAGDG